MFLVTIPVLQRPWAKVQPQKIRVEDLPVIVVIIGMKIGILREFLDREGDKVVSCDGTHLHTQQGRVYERLGGGTHHDEELGVDVTRRIWVEVLRA